MEHRYANVNNSYFKAYIQYNLAEIGINILEGTKTLGEKYLKNKPVLYHNYEYMKFFNNYFNGYLEQFALTGRGNDINTFIQSANYHELSDVLRINPLLKSNDSLCDLVLLKGLYELYYSGNYSKESIKTLLTRIASQSTIEEDRIVANDMIQSFSAVTTGAGSPEFALKDSKGIVNSILDFRGRYLYLCFCKSNSDQCLSELTVMASLNKKYGKKINFVSISEDKNISVMQHFLDQNKIFTWPFLFDEGGKILEKYDVKSLPEFFLINPQGKFFLSPADAPSHGIELIFDKLLEHKKPNNQ
jgi:peroxiredoxin